LEHFGAGEQNYTQGEWRTPCPVLRNFTDFIYFI
jgi:hypothetical protein